VHHRLAASVWNVELEIAAERHVEDLHAAADPEHGKLRPLERDAEELELEGVALRNHAVHGFVLIVDVIRGIQISAPRKHEGVERVENARGSRAGGAEQNRDAPRAGHGVQVGDRQ
jgi:hypothetical protein